MIRVGIVLETVIQIHEGHTYEEVVKRAIPILEDSSEFCLDIILEQHFHNAYELDSALGHIYSVTRDILLKNDLYFSQINVLFNLSELSAVYEVLFIDISKNADKYSYKKLETYQYHSTCTNLLCDYEDLPPNRYGVSAVGGTFDHLHDGHKILLSVALFITKDRLIIGLTDQELLAKKKHIRYLESFATRADNVSIFLKMLKPTLHFEIIAIRDVCGPTGSVPDIESLVVSRETLAGGDFVNKTRLEKGLSRLDIIVVNVLGGREEDGWKEKMSSTDLRDRECMLSKKS